MGKKKQPHHLHDVWLLQKPTSKGGSVVLYRRRKITYVTSDICIYDQSGRLKFIYMPEEIFLLLTGNPANRDYMEDADKDNRSYKGMVRTMEIVAFVGLLCVNRLGKEEKV